MSDRKQEKLGWTFGWFGGFVWVIILSIVQWVKGQTFEASTGLLIAALGCLTIVFLSPWRHPRTRFWVLMTPIYGLILISIGWGAWASGGWQEVGITSGWSALILMPVLMPLWIIGKRRWDDGGQK